MQPTRWLPVEVASLCTWVRAVAGWLRHHRPRGERGSNTLETIVIAALLFAAAVTVATLIVGKIREYMGKLG